MTACGAHVPRKPRGFWVCTLPEKHSGRHEDWSPPSGTHRLPWLNRAWPNDSARGGTFHPRRALIVVDVQNDFCEGGSLAVPGGERVASRIAEYVFAHASEYYEIVTTQDSHVDPKGHFSDTPDFKDTWPVHCVAGTKGIEIHPNFMPAMELVTEAFAKGAYTAAYSGFEAHSVTEWFMTGSETLLLGRYLELHGITQVVVVGIATDYCVKATALDAVKQGYATRVLLNLTAAVAPSSTHDAIEEMRAAGVTLQNHVKGMK